MAGSVYFATRSCADLQPSYERWAKIFNLKQAAQTLLYLQDENLTEYSKLEQAVSEAKDAFAALSDKLKVADSRITEISALQKHIINYSNTRVVYDAYRKSGFSKKFRAEHESEILINEAAKKAFKALNLEKLPTMKPLQIEYATLTAEKKKLYQTYRAARERMQKLQTVKYNTDRLLNYSSDSPEGLGYFPASSRYDLWPYLHCLKRIVMCFKTLDYVGV